MNDQTPWPAGIVLVPDLPAPRRWPRRLIAFAILAAVGVVLGCMAGAAILDQHTDPSPIRYAVTGPVPPETHP